MSKNPNNKTVYIHDGNLEMFDTLKNKGDFFNWCLRDSTTLKNYAKYLLSTKPQTKK
jgi:hypothetical protein